MVFTFGLLGRTLRRGAGPRLAGARGEDGGPAHRHGAAVEKWGNPLGKSGERWENWGKSYGFFLGNMVVSSGRWEHPLVNMGTALIFDGLARDIHFKKWKGL